MKGRKTMTDTTKTSTYTNGWNAVVKALENDDDISNFEAKVKQIQIDYDPNHGLFHYAQGAKDCLAEYEKPGIDIPPKI